MKSRLFLSLSILAAALFIKVGVRVYNTKLCYELASLKGALHQQLAHLTELELEKAYMIREEKLALKTSSFQTKEVRIIKTVSESDIYLAFDPAKSRAGLGDS